MKLSFSAVQKYLKCPKLYNLHYNIGLREKNIGSALLFGTAVDEALNVFLKDRNAPLADVFAAFKDKWTTQNISGTDENIATSDKVVFYNGDFDVDVLLDHDIELIFNSLRDVGYEFDHQNLDKIHKELCTAKREKRFGTDERYIFNYISWYSMLRKGEMMLEAYAIEVLPNIVEILDVQKFFSINNGEGDEVIGYMDMRCRWIDGRIVKFDHKTSSKKYEEDAVENSEQLATYTVGFKDQYPEDTAGFIVFEKNIRKRTPRVRIQVLIGEIPQSLQDKVIDQYDSACAQIKTGEYPANLSSCEDEKGFRCSMYNFCHRNGDMTGLIKVDKKK